jgi:DNA-binding NarL/FixJ family response regulator
MGVLREVVIVSSSPIFATALQEWLQSSLKRVRCCVLDPGSAVPSHTAAEEVVILLVPQDWREMILWLPEVQTRFPAHPWLLLADLRLAGMFLSFLETRLCTLVAPSALPETLSTSLQVLAEGQAVFPPARLADVFSQGLCTAEDGQDMMLTHREVECGCAASLGVSNLQIAQALHLGVGTVKNHVHSLMRKLEIARRGEVFAWFALRATAPPPAPRRLPLAAGRAASPLSRHPRPSAPSLPDRRRRSLRSPPAAEPGPHTPTSHRP